MLPKVKNQFGKKKKESVQEPITVKPASLEDLKNIDFSIHNVYKPLNRTQLNSSEFEFFIDKVSFRRINIFDKDKKCHGFIVIEKSKIDPDNKVFLSKFPQYTQKELELIIQELENSKK